MNKLNSIGVENLSIAIIEQACEDYAKAYMGEEVAGKTPDHVIGEVERFFDSDLYEMMTDFDKERMSRSVKINELTKHIENFERMLNEKGRIKLCITDTKYKKGMNFTVPPRLTSEFITTIRYYIDELKDEKRKLTRID